MNIAGVCSELGTTKKAINYYQKQGLISADTDSGGYRDFSRDDVEKIREILVYRKLGISVQDIRKLLEGDKTEHLKEILIEKKKNLREQKIHLSCIEKLISSESGHKILPLIFNELSESETNDTDYVIKKLKEAFPGGLGLFISIHFSSFKFEKIKTEAQHRAWSQIIDYLDGEADIELPESALQFLDMFNKDTIHKAQDSMKEYINKQDISEDEYKMMKIKKDEIMESINAFDGNIAEDFRIFQQTVKEFFSDKEYLENVVENMKILSREYSEYCKNLKTMNTKIEKYNT